MMAGATRALLVGAGSSSQSALRLPPGTDRNVSALREALTDPLVGGLAPDLCQTVQAAGGDSVLRHMAKASAGDGALIVYWTGHATLSAEGALHLALPGSLPGDLTTWVPARRVTEAMTVDRSAAADRLLILDTCFSSWTGIVSGNYDGLVRRAVERVSRSGVAVLSSMGTTPTGFAANSHGLSVFTRQLIAQLQGGADASSDGLRLETLYRLLGTELDRNGYRRPCLRNAAAFRRPLAAATGTALRESSGLLPARRSSSHLTADVMRYALAVAGAVPTAGTPEQPFHDARRVYQALLKSRCGFTERSSTLLDSPPTLHALRASLEKMAHQGRNMLLVYVSSSGTVDADADGLDLRLGLAGQESVSVSDLVRDLQRARAERVTLLIDACQAHTVGEPQPDTYDDDASRPPWGKRPGFTQLAITWSTSAASSWLSALDPVALSAQEQMPLPSAWLTHSALLKQPLQQPADQARWKFYFPGADISCVDDQGPLSPWLALHATRLASADTGVAHWLLSDFSAAAAVPTAVAPDEETPRSTAADEVVEEEAPRPKARRQRGHRARLHVLDDDPAAAAEAGVHVSFRYQPLDEENETLAVPATEDAPLDITLRIRATSATVQPSLIHTHLTDERGSPPSDFRVVPESQDPVTLRIDVLRRADGALIQQLRTVLPAAEAEGSKL
ncbi:hypothetical protein [Streptomyces sp. NPDC005799]|uniref:hypothetical protein n=1 Tax=Streptomyces sp. NPDC005799 TaxID=3154678 RepID=UPI0033F7D910